MIPADSEYFAALRDAAVARGAKVVSFGRAAHADVRLLDALPGMLGGTLITADMGDARLCYTVAAPGEHWVINSLDVMAAVRAVGGDLGAAGLALAEMQGMAGRGIDHAPLPADLAARHALDDIVPQQDADIGLAAANAGQHLFLKADAHRSADVAIGTGKARQRLAQHGMGEGALAGEGDRLDRRARRQAGTVGEPAPFPAVGRPGPRRRRRAWLCRCS